MAAARRLLVFDGECGFCTSSARWVSVRWRGDARAVPWQTLDDGDLVAHGLTRAEASAAAWWLEPDGRSFRGHLAIAHALAAGSGWPARAGRILMVAPVRWLAAPLYALVSRLRRRLPGGTPACSRRDGAAERRSSESPR
ncbi:MAG: DUF393 domain-containing protein [Actinobacteria bacterium]|nr:DUF393 domain-containing protein [Actinomycetota bacterium]